ncbi:COG3014 family protein [Achromobacter sp. NPDC058515]|uniref:COG3014 family protein n=1 Tax=Achromobacter sp. NPDC058515 TaxID=3346533 RepID=UPI00364D48BE
MKWAVVLGLTVALAGCANPQARKDFSRDLGAGNLPAATSSAVQAAGPLDGEPNNLPWALEAGALLRQSGLPERSTQMLDGAENLMKDDDTRNVAASAGNHALSVVVNDNVLPYAPAVYDTVMLNTYKALNFWQIGDYANARVEWNRTDDRQRRAVEHFEAEITKQRDEIKEGENAELVGRSLSSSDEALRSAGVDVSQWKPYAGYVNPAAIYLHGLYFLFNGEGQADADKARSSLERAYALTKNTQIKIDMAAAKSKRTALKPAVWVVFENGTAAHKEELRIDLPLFLVSGNVKYTGIALPVMRDGTPAYPHLTVGRQQTQMLADMDSIIRGEFKTRFNAILIKEVVRATAKTVLQKQINDSNPLLGTLTAVAQAASTQADLRSWSTLPHNFQLMAVPYPESRQLALGFPGHEDIVVDLPKEKRPVVVYVRALNAAMQPRVDILASK